MFRKVVLVLMVVVGLVAIGSLFVNARRYSRQEIKSCFNDAGGLRTGAAVRIAGVEVGTIRSVRADPQDKNCPAEVEMALATTYEIKIPKDAIAGTNTAGLLGEVYVNIDITQASGAPIENYGYLKSKPIKNALSAADQLKATELLVRMVQTATEREKETPKDNAAPTHP